MALCRLGKGLEEEVSSRETIVSDLKINATAGALSKHRTMRERFIHGASLIAIAKNVSFSHGTKLSPKDPVVVMVRSIANNESARANRAIPVNLEREKARLGSRVGTSERASERTLGLCRMMIAMRTSTELCNIVQYRWIVPPATVKLSQVYREPFMPDHLINRLGRDHHKT